MLLKLNNLKNGQGEDIGHMTLTCDVKNHVELAHLLYRAIAYPRKGTDHLSFAEQLIITGAGSVAIVPIYGNRSLSIKERSNSIIVIDQTCGTISETLETLEMRNTMSICDFINHHIDQAFEENITKEIKSVVPYKLKGFIGAYSISYLISTFFEHSRKYCNDKVFNKDTHYYLFSLGKYCVEKQKKLYNIDMNNILSILKTIEEIQGEENV